MPLRLRAMRTLKVASERQYVYSFIPLNLPMPAVDQSFDRLRIDGRAGGARNHQRRPAEEELVDPVPGAVLGQLPQIEHLAHVKAHGRDHHPMPGLVHLLGLVWPHLDAPGVRTHASHLLVMQPIAALEFEARGVAAGIASPLATLAAGFHLPGADDDEIAFADRNLLRLGAGIEVIVGNALAIPQAIDSLEAGDIEQYAAADQLVLGVLDAKLAETV